MKFPTEWKKKPFMFQENHPPGIYDTLWTVNITIENDHLLSFPIKMQDSSNFRSENRSSLIRLFLNPSLSYPFHRWSQVRFFHGRSCAKTEKPRRPLKGLVVFSIMVYKHINNIIYIYIYICIQYIIEKWKRFSIIVKCISAFMFSLWLLHVTS